MNRFVVAIAAACIAAVALTGCVAPAERGPDPEAERAAKAYTAELQTWSAGLTAAVPNAKTWTQAEIDAADAEDATDALPEETGMGEVLDEVPELEKVDDAAAERTPAYRRAAAVAAHVAGIAADLRSLEPAEAKRLRKAGTAAYYVGADLYYETLGGPAAGRLDAYSESIDSDITSAKGRRLLREADAAFARERIELLDAAIAAMQGSRKDATEPTVPDSPIGESVGAFIIDWYQEDRAFEQGALAEIESWEELPEQYGEFWGFEDLDGVFRAALEHAAELRPMHAETVAGLAADAAAGREPTAFAGDAYRTLLLGGYLSWGDPGEGAERAVGRLWMLWRIRELEGTLDAAYGAARAALLEELNRGIPDGTVRDHRPGSARALSAVEAFSDEAAYAPGDREEDYEPLLTRVSEAISYAEQLREAPMMSEVAADYDTVLDEFAAVQRELIDLLENPDPDLPTALAQHEIDMAVIEHGDGLAERLVAALTPSLTMLDDDAAFSARLAELVAQTAPGAAA